MKKTPLALCVEQYLLWISPIAADTTTAATPNPTRAQRALYEGRAIIPRAPPRTKPPILAELRRRIERDPWS
jgi:hypothetical protein